MVYREAQTGDDISSHNPKPLHDELNLFFSTKLLQFAITNGMIDLSSVQEEMDKQECEYYLSLHPYRVWQGENGKWYTYLQEKEGRKLKKRNTEEDIRKLIAEHYKSQKTNPNIRDVFMEWITEKLEFGEIGRGSYDRYYNDYKRFFMESYIEKIDFLDITEDDLEKFIRKTIVDHGLTRRAFAGFRTLIFGIFKHAKKKKYTSISITQFMGDLELPKNAFRRVNKDREDQIYMEDEIPLVTEYLKSNPIIINLGILLAFQTGIRTGELAALKSDDIKGKIIHIQRQEIKYKDPITGRCVHKVVEYPKTENGDRHLIITDSAIETITMIRRINPDGEYLFEVNRKRILTNSYNDALARVCRELKIHRKSMHKIRRAYGTSLLDGNVDESIVMEQMGHKDIETTRKFYYFSNKNQKSKEAQIAGAINV